MIKVEYIGHMGSDITAVNAARVSFGNSKTTIDEKDKKLIKYLADHKHMSPFEHMTLTTKVSCPLYIRSQIHRHRTFSYNEISRRYTSKDMEFFIPNNLRAQASNNRQASKGVLDDSKSLIEEISKFHKSSMDFYNLLITKGVCREQARGVLCQDLMTEFYMTGNLRNWTHFVKLREHEGAQKEVQEIANMVKTILIDKFGYSAEVLLNEDV